MSEPAQPAAPEDRSANVNAGEEVDALPVLAREPRALYTPLHDGLPGEWRGAGALMPAVQAAAVAAGGFVAGAAVVGLVHRRHKRSSVLSAGRRAGRGRGSRRGGPGELVQIVASRSLLLDVHLLGAPGDR